MTTSVFPQTWDLASLAPAPLTALFREQLDQFKQRLKNLAVATNSLPPVDARAENVARWVTLIAEYELVDATGADYRALADCYAAADAENKSYRQLQAELAAITPDREQIATNVEFALRDATESDFLAFVETESVFSGHAET